MKTILRLTIMATMGILLMSSCKKSDDSVTPSGINVTIQQGPWEITFFEDNGTNETSNYNGYSFTFNSNGSATAVNGSNTINGTWAKGTDDSKEKLILNFGNSSPFDELNEDWEIIQYHSSLIRLVHVSGGNGETDYLTFEKD